MHYASLRGLLEVAISLIDHEANINAEDEFQDTPLHHACRNGHMELAMALGDRGADVDARDVVQRTPLDYVNMENRNRLESMINRNVGNVMTSMMPRIEERDSARRISGLPQEIGRHVGSYLGGKRKTKKRKTRRRKTRKH